VDYAALLVLAIVVFVLNVIPWFVPPTWLVLLLYTAAYDLPIIPTAIIAVVFASLGKVALYYLANRYLLRYIPKRSRENIDYLGRFLDRQKKLSISLFLFYTLLPISTSELFIAGGLARFDLKILIICFALGRTFSYTFWIVSGHLLLGNFQELLSSNFSNIGLIVSQAIGLVVLYIYQAQLVEASTAF
jgi:membrane protein YqaA with SNARE-associated domain